MGRSSLGLAALASLRARLSMMVRRSRSAPAFEPTRDSMHASHRLD